ncbi:hypothetical protein B0O99DRAFT_393024 [Bisporella sp. PMI_857]|nr:hypothetical protein B0O99DRAFT_393024 [Bisporella sp. PMI_857]
MSTPLPSTFRSAPPEAIYSTKDALFAALQTHGRDNGYAIITRSTKPNRVLFDCDRGGNYDPKGKSSNTHSSRQRNNTGSKKCGCKMRVAVTALALSRAWRQTPQSSVELGPCCYGARHPRAWRLTLQGSLTLAPGQCPVYKALLSFPSSACSLFS